VELSWRSLTRKNVPFVEGSNESIPHRLAGLDGGRLYAVLIGPAVEVFADKLRAIVEHDTRWAASCGHQLVRYHENRKGRQL